MVAMGNLRDPQTALAIFGLLFMAALLAWGVRAAILIGVLGTTVAGVLFGLVHWQPQTYGLSDISSTAMQLDIRGAMRLGLVEIVFAFLFVDLFDSVGTLVAVGQKAGCSIVHTRFCASIEFCSRTQQQPSRAHWRERRPSSATSKARRVSRREGARVLPRSSPD
jgi:xanthine/uracil/vitamin C permease (AzgA family)